MKLSNHLDPSTFPKLIRLYTDGCRLYDTGSASRFRTFLVQGDQPLYLKIGARGSLSQERDMLSFLHGAKICAAVVSYQQEGGFDYLLTAALPGETGEVPAHLHSPKHLAALVGESLHRLHSLPVSGCPWKGPGQTTVEQAKNQSLRLDDATARRLDALGQLAADDSLVHGDFHLSDMVINRWKLSGFTGLSRSGLGDRHYDIAKALWELSRQLGDGGCKEALLDAYGREFIDPARLECFEILVAQGL